MKDFDLATDLGEYERFWFGDRNLNFLFGDLFWNTFKSYIMGHRGMLGLEGWREYNVDLLRTSHLIGPVLLKSIRAPPVRVEEVCRKPIEAPSGTDFSESPRSPSPKPNISRGYKKHCTHKFRTFSCFITFIVSCIMFFSVCFLISALPNALLEFAVLMKVTLENSKQLLLNIQVSPELGRQCAQKVLHQVDLTSCIL